MHAYLSVILLAVLQGLTEFLPISSSGHLVIAAKYLQFNPPGVRLEMILHFGTLLAVCLYYRRRLWRLIGGLIHRESGAWLETGYLLLATVPIVVVYGLAHTWLDARYEDPRLAAWMLLVTGCLLLALQARRVGDGPDRGAPAPRPVNAWRALAIGLAQVVAILPGISRSGTTIVMARHLGAAPARAAEFSFLMAIPPLLGGTLLKLMQRDPGGTATPADWLALCLGMVVAAGVGYGAMVLLMRVLNRGRFWAFGLYCLAAGAMLLSCGV